MNISEPDSPELLKLAAKIVSSIGQLLGNILNQGNTAATLPEDAMSSKMSSEMPSAATPEAKDVSMSSKCLPKGASRPKRKQASKLKMVS